MCVTVTVFSHHGGKHPFPQAPIRDTQALARPQPHQRFQYCTARKHQIGSIGPDAGLSHPVLIWHIDKGTGYLPHLTGFEPTSINSFAIISRQFQIGRASCRERV